MVRNRKKLGVGFPDEVAKINFKSGHFKNSNSYDDWKDVLLHGFSVEKQSPQGISLWLSTFFLVISLILFFALFLKLFHLQIVHGKKNRELADGNRIQIKVIHAPRGVIFDRNGKVLAANSPGFRLVDPETKKTSFLTREEALELEVKNDPRVSFLEVDNIRTYPLGEKGAHVVGIVGEISPEELADNQLKNYKQSFQQPCCYKSGDLIGKTGIEANYEQILRGINGGELVEVDSYGRKLRAIRRNEPIPGRNIYLTIDADFQEKIFQSTTETISKTGSCCAAAAAIDPLSGQILALVSYPSFNPNLFTNGNNESVIAEVLSDPNAPLLNRVIAGTYPPGSTFKIISAIAALSGGITAQTTFEDTGITRLGSFTFANWYFTQHGKTEGSVNLVKALKRSNDSYFYRAGQVIGEQPLIEWSKKLGLGKKLGIDLPGEAEGLVPDGGWKEKTFGQPWYPGDTLHMAIGQGFLLTTPLQVLGFTSFAASGGSLYQPQLVSKIMESERMVQEFKPKLLVSGQVSAEHLAIIKNGLEEVVKDGGTAWPFFTFPIATAGKTGTAEFGHPKNKTHAWYTAYAPADDPKIAMVVLVEAGGEGSSVAAPIVKEAFRWYFSPNKKNLIKDIYPVATQSAKALGE